MEMERRHGRLENSWITSGHNIRIKNITTESIKSLNKLKFKSFNEAVLTVFQNLN